MTRSWPPSASPVISGPTTGSTPPPQQRSPKPDNSSTTHNEPHRSQKSEGQRQALPSNASTTLTIPDGEAPGGTGDRDVHRPVEGPHRRTRPKNPLSVFVIAGGPSTDMRGTAAWNRPVDLKVRRGGFPGNAPSSQVGTIRVTPTNVVTHN